MLAQPFLSLHFFSRVFRHLNISPDNSITSCVQFWQSRLTGLNKHSHALSHYRMQTSAVNLDKDSFELEEWGGGGWGWGVQVSFTINIHIHKFKYTYFTFELTLTSICFLSRNRVVITT